MLLKLKLAWLILVGSPLRAWGARFPAALKLESALKSVPGPTAYVGKKLRTYSAAGGTLSPHSVGSRFVIANAKADQIIEGCAQSLNGPESRKDWSGQAVRVLVEDFHYLSRGRERTLLDIIQGRTELAARRQERRVRMMSRLRPKAQAIIAEALFSGTQD